jgi:general secretion pathway protein B
VPPRTVTLGELGADLRRELPPLAVGGAIWSENAARRFVLVNGQVVREGETAAPGVVLERIGPKSVLLRWREMRIEVPL